MHQKINLLFWLNQKYFALIFLFPLHYLKEEIIFIIYFLFEKNYLHIFHQNSLFFQSEKVFHQEQFF